VRFLALLLLIFSTLASLAQETPVSKKQRILQADTSRRPTTATQTRPTAQPSGRGSQIVDDSTKNVYGPKTTLWITENDIYLNKKNYQPLDTAIQDYHRWTFIQRLNNFYQDLGNVGTSLNPIFPQAPVTIGATPGYATYAPYFDLAEPRYFDSKSPYTRILLVWGGDGRARSHIEFTRNINPRWNFGFNYRPTLVDKQVQRVGKGDRQTISHYYDLYTSYKSKNERYQLLASYRRIRHRVFENGGILLSFDTTFAGYFDENVSSYLSAARSEELRNVVHLFHQYQLASPFQLYHKADFTRQSNLFSYLKSQEANYNAFYGYTNPDSDINTDTVSDGTRFNTIVNEFGIKGKAAFFYYSLYYKLRFYNTSNKYLDNLALPYDKSRAENYLGGQIAFRFDSLSELSGQAEYLLDGNYRLHAQLRTPWLDATGTSSLVKPGFLPQAYRGSHHQWINSFNDPFTNQLSAFLKVKWGRLFISPGATYTALSNYVYYKTNDKVNEPTVVAAQSGGNQQLFVPELRMSLRFFRHVYLRPQVLYTSVLNNDDGALQIPKWFANAQLAYENMLFKGNLQVQIGVDAHWRSEYLALDYDPAIQQYFVQNSTRARAFPLVDVFFNGKFKRGRFFVKYHNLQQVISGLGYLPTPNYRGQGSILDFGFDLILFD
jgi:Putative porin